MSKMVDYTKRQLADNQERIKLWFPVLFGLGIGLYFLPSTEPSKWFTLGVIEALIFFAILFRHYISVLKIILILGCITAGFANIQLQSIYQASKRNNNLPNYPLYVQGQIIEADFNIKGNSRYTFDGLQDYDENQINGRYRITSRDKQDRFKVGDCVEMIANISSLPKSVIPNGYQFDRKNFYEGYSGSGYAASPLYLIDCPQPYVSQWFDLSSLRHKISQKILKILPLNEATVIASLITGDRTLISKKITNNYRDSGLAHFLSISGLHMTMIAGLMFFLTRFILALIPLITLHFDTKKISAFLAIIISMVYLGLSGAEVPAIRAFIMTFIVLLGVLMNRRAISMYTIAIAAFIILAIYPHVLISASFQMSFAAVVCLIAFYEKCAEKLNHFVDKSSGNLVVKSFKILLLYFVGVLVSDFIASMATLPLAVYHFNRIALYTSLANLTAAPIIGFVIMPFILLSLLMMPLGLAELPLKIAGYGVAKVNDITAWVSSMDGAAYLMMSEPLWGLCLIVFGGLWLCIWQTQIRHWGWWLILLGALSVITVKKPDILISADAKVVAVRDNQDNLVILPSRGKNFIKQQWLDKTASQPLSKQKLNKLRKIYHGKETDYKWLDLACSPRSCFYKKQFQIIKGKELRLNGKKLDTNGTEGMAIYLNPQPKIQTIRDDIGTRLWNSN